jgi:hypothetical protein
MNEQEKREILKKRLSDKVKNKEISRFSNEKKEGMIKIDSNLEKLGINSMDDMKNFMESIKDIDRGQLISQLSTMGVDKKQVDDLFEMFKLS